MSEHPWIKSRLAELGKTQAGLAAVLGEDRSRVTQLIKGTRTPQLAKLPAMAGYLEISVAELFQRFLAVPMKSEPLTADELAWLGAFHALDDAEKGMMLRIMQAPAKARAAEARSVLGSAREQQPSEQDSRGLVRKAL